MIKYRSVDRTSQTVEASARACRQAQEQGKKGKVSQLWGRTRRREEAATAGRTRTGRTRAACWLADCDGGGIWLTLTGSFGEGEGRGLVESSWVEWSGGATAPMPPSPRPLFGSCLDWAPPRNIAGPVDDWCRAPGAYNRWCSK